MRAILALLLMATPALAQPQANCAERAKVVKKLADQFGETLKSVGLRDGEFVEIYSSDETGTWTIITSRPDGTACLLAAGQLWEQNVKPIDPPGVPS
jgi:hypothetical protein